MISVRRRLLGAYIGLIILPILFSGSIFHHTAWSFFRSMSESQTMQTLRATDLVLRTSFREIETISDLFITSDIVQRLLTMVNNNDQINPVILESMKRSSSIYLSGNNRIRGAVLYGKDAEILDYGYMGAPAISNLQLMPIYKSAKVAAGRPLWFGPVDSSDLTSLHTPLLTQIRTVKDFYTLKDVGLLVLYIDTSIVEQVFFELFKGEANKVFILNDRGTIQFASEKVLLGKWLDLGMEKELFVGEGCTVFTEWKGESVQASCVRSELGWTLVSLNSWSGLERAGALFNIITIALVVPLILLAMFFNFFFMNRFSRFMDTLSAALHRLSGGDLTVRLGAVEGQEFVTLRDDFNSMAEQIGELVKRIEYEQTVKKDAEFKMLQAQIKPHFLYNTLETINALATQRGQKEIHGITVNLGKLLRLSISKDDSLTIADEIAHVRSYLEIQKIRYDKRFEYAIHFDERMANKKIVKLILQPIVENAIYHGMETMENGGFIDIKGIMEGDSTAIFMIHDNGCGISASVLENISQEAVRRSHRTQQDKNKIADKTLGHGLMSVWERLRIVYGPDYGLLICNNGDGTLVRIRIPLEGGSFVPGDHRR